MTLLAGSIEVDSRALPILTVDMTAWIEGATLETGTSELVRVRNGQNYAGGLFGPQAVEGTLVAQQLQDLEPGERYFLILVCTAGGETFAPRIQISCPSL